MPNDKGSQCLVNGEFSMITKCHCQTLNGVKPTTLLDFKWYRWIEATLNETNLLQNPTIRLAMIQKFKVVYIREDRRRKPIELTMVILTYIDDGEFPKSRNIEGLEDLALIGRPITIKCKSYALTFVILLTKCKTWQSSLPIQVQSNDPKGALHYLNQYKEGATLEQRIYKVLISHSSPTPIFPFTHLG